MRIEQLPNTPPENIEVHGPFGAKKKDGQIILPDEGYRVSNRRIEIPDELWDFGVASYELFTKKFQRAHPWEFDQRYFYDMRGMLPRVAREATKSDEVKFKMTGELTVIDLNALKNERIDELTAHNIASSWAVEAALSEYSRDGIGETRNSPGEAAFYPMWTGEEYWHDATQKRILIDTGAKTEKELWAMRRELKEREWISPFTTHRRMRLYPYFQEDITMAIYDEIATKLLGGIPSKLAFEYAKEERRYESSSEYAKEILTGGSHFRGSEAAPVAAYMMKANGDDEGYHRAWFGGLINLDAQLDKKGTEQDTYFVVRHFRMPGDYFLLNPIESAKAFHRNLGITHRWMAGKLYKGMQRLGFENPETGKGFIDPNKAFIVTAEYARTLKMEKEEVDDLLQMPSDELKTKMDVDPRFLAAKERTDKEVFRPKIIAA